MLTTQNIESELSYAYLHAVASRAGVVCESTGRHGDDAGVDAVLRLKGRLSTESILTQFTVEVQLKATKQSPIEKEGRYSQSLKIKNYDELRSMNTGAPQLLIVYYLPGNSEAWLEQSEECLIARRCAYWVSLRGAPEVEADSKTVYLPKTNVLSVESLKSLFTRFSKLEVFEYVE